MTKSEFKDIAKQYLYLDGATGSNLVRAGMPSGVSPEQWILEHPDVMLDLQRQYVAAGTNILYAPTFTANRIKLAEYGLEGQLEDIIRKLTAISRQAAAEALQPVYIAGDLTMTGAQLKPMGNLELEQLITVYKEQIAAMEQAGVDLLVIETMMSLAETRAALIAAKEVCDLPVMVTMTFEADGRTLYGTDAKTAAVVLESLGASAIGVNCSTGPAHMRQIVADMVSCKKNVPIIAKPNAGLPCLDDSGDTCYNMNADEFAEEMKMLVEAGASLLGGCCGTTPEFIRRLHDTFGTGPVPVIKRKADGIRMLSSERQTVEFGLEDGFFIVGERINPTGKKLLQAQLREGNFNKVLQFAEEQEKSGARILDVNMGMSGIDEKAVMLQALDEISMVTNLPLSLDSSHVDVLEAALRHYPGRALVNSVSMEKEKMDILLPLVKKYGAMFILLPLSDKGLPTDIQEKKQIIETVLERAYSLGLQDEDIIVDGLVSTVGASKKAALETLETIRYCREKGLASVCGLSNISFGMPERSYVNTAFLTLAIREGLTMAIANPSQELLVSCALATDMLLNKEEADIRYIEYAGTVAEKRVQKETALQRQMREGVLQKPPNKAAELSSPESETGIRVTIRNSVLKGNRKGIPDQVREALAEGEEPSVLLNEVLLPAINEVGELFDKGKYFLPQLIASGEAMKNAVEILEPLLLRETDSRDKPVVIIATVEGDIHDIGKNLVALMLKNYGFRVIDLGKDVPKEEIIRAARENHAQIIALSALMTTTMRRMKEVIEYAGREGLTAKIMIGGAVITQDYADEIGADGYSADAAEAVKLARRLTGR
ncbi:homocysteine S-methyltransferase family protein [Acetatifactor muris]|uniref:Methionine synthase n=1 Tax=Acetatifactor muris TaxID=879566 RepID=A0A2K4ZH15_9FIRM|nr:homocysteine S-methyltransferase family protein [Acetatifactor muris]MCR2047958.1 homocysteine S-methyltransferase family protein [Acetatifactor muris]SOY29760.1 Methionine synthase [Acetatifactor muris]